MQKEVVKKRIIAVPNFDRTVKKLPKGHPEAELWLTITIQHQGKLLTSRIPKSVRVVPRQPCRMVIHIENGILSIPDQDPKVIRDVRELLVITNTGYIIHTLPEVVIDKKENSTGWTVKVGNSVRSYTYASLRDMEDMLLKIEKQPSKANHRMVFHLPAGTNTQLISFFIRKIKDEMEKRITQFQILDK